ncbi:Anti-sigma regulatory factor (Ser/Thr protein kinase) [Quadrisphaera granulorum]|uniref:Anti-sigma regulatory factor (Ser/Thr protein kinase) n=1 Tax=Quadrisphaera granulorum TaxID=317664 RepID=A0A315ZZJ8_9ACTN|nr:ATP-binding protein [Quadrisphaera granulorum]PWJ50682.1 anti-sigma regulatory factor (Ser/Thr protein kinase) [Quadrisphaera granulorum]SZE97930.1 Anti-sigma regulatory factor (Ser/Thr protein kinase) [Quadrisphaera granulorum]
MGLRRTLPLAGEPASARSGRAAATELLGRVGAPESLVESVVLVVSELVTNAVRHAPGPLELLLEADATSASVGVRDTSAVRPALVEPYDGGGRGMLVVATVAVRWHVEEVPGGKVVWAHLHAD